MGDFGRVARKISKLPDKLENSLDSEIESETKLMSSTANRNLVQNRSVATGELLGKTRHTELQRPEHFTTHAVRAHDPKARFVEYGTGYRGEGRFKSPGAKPPVDNILEWIVEKGIQPYAYDTQYALADAIAETIQAYGTRPHPFMRPAWREHKHNFSSRGSHAISKAVRRSL